MTNGRGATIRWWTKDCFTSATLELKFDTRTDPDDPWAGWYLNADIEHGRGTIAAGRTDVRRCRRPSAPGVDDYTRGFFDFRRYNRLGPEAQLNMRVVLGGWLGGDPLPLERRLSVDGPGALPGFGFRNAGTGTDVGTCNQGLGRAGPAGGVRSDRARADRISRRSATSTFSGDWTGWPRRYHSGRGDVLWVLFADAGPRMERGTAATDRSPTRAARCRRCRRSARISALGLDFAGFGVYAAKALSTPEPVNFFVRLRHRF